MHPEGFKPFRDSLTSVFTIAWLVVGFALVVDLFTGSNGVAWLVGLQLKAVGHDPAVESMRMMTVFGTFTSVTKWTTFVQRFLLVVSFAFAGFPLLRGLWVSISGK